jgi:hypothetical protein
MQTFYMFILCYILEVKLFNMMETKISKGSKTKSNPTEVFQLIAK